MASAAALDRPRYLTLPASMNYFIAPTTSSTGTFGSGKCWQKHIDDVDIEVAEAVFDHLADVLGAWVSGVARG